MTNMSKFVFIAGGGYFGTNAVRFYKARRDMNVLFSDIDVNCPAGKYADLVIQSLDELDFSKGVNMIVADAAEVLTELFARRTIPELIIPAVPGHFAAKALKNYLERNGLKVSPFKDPLENVYRELSSRGLAISVDKANSVIVCSYMPFDLKCKVPCPQPEICPVTKRRKEKAMYELLNEIVKNVDVAYILHSSLITKNVGGFKGKELLEVVNECLRRKHCSLMIGTACRCHGIVNFLKIESD